MEQQLTTFSEDLKLLSDCLGEGIEQQWSHELRKQILLLLHKLKNFSRKASDIEIESELMAIEVTMGYGTGSVTIPDITLVEDHQLRLLELAEPDKDPEQSSDGEFAQKQEPSQIAEITLSDDEQFSDNKAIQPIIQLVLCNCPGRDAARELAQGIVKARHAACVNIIANIGAIYWWQGEIKDTAECQLQVKTVSHCVDDVIHYIKQNHPFDVPEILVFPVDKGNEEYFDWVKQETNAIQDD